jgi:hypothetical protein
VTSVETATLSSLQLRRSFGALCMFVAMVVVESRAAEDGSVLPALDSIERVVSRAMLYLRDIDPKIDSHAGPLRGLVVQLLQSYVALATVFRDRVLPILGVQNSLAVNALSECVDYSLRILRFAGYWACAGLACLDAVPQNQLAAKAFADAIAEMCKTNAVYAAPVTDDQVIELGLIWELFFSSRAE